MSHAPSHTERLTHEAVQHRAAGVSCARVLPGAAQLRSDLVLTGLRRIEPTGHEEQMLDRRLAGPRAEDSCRLPGCGLAPRQDAEDLLARVARSTPILGRVQHLDAIAGTDVEDLGSLE